MGFVGRSFGVVLRLHINLCMCIFCITKHYNYMKSNIITIRLSNDCILAYRFLQSKK